MRGRSGTRRSSSSSGEGKWPEPAGLAPLALAPLLAGDVDLEPAPAERPPEERLDHPGCRIRPERIIGSERHEPPAGAGAHRACPPPRSGNPGSNRPQTSFAGVWIFGAAQLVWGRFNQGYRFSVADTPDGLRLHGGLVALTTETIRPGRIQAVRMVEPLFWRPFGWCRLEVDVAGKQRRKGEGREAGRRLRAVLPVGPLPLADELLDRLVPDRPRTLAPAPERVRWKSPLRYGKLGWARTETCVMTRSGRLRRVTCWVPLGKVQSLREVQGPVQRRLQLASVHLDTAGGNVHAILRDRDAAEADRVLVELVDLAEPRGRRPERPRRGQSPLASRAAMAELADDAARGRMTRALGECHRPRAAVWTCLRGA